MCEDSAAETFAPVDVEDADEGVLLDVGDQSFVDVLHDPVEELGVDVLGQRVTSVGGLEAGEGLDVRLRGRLQLPVAQPLGHVLVGDADQVAERRQVAVVWLERDHENGVFECTEIQWPTCQSSSSTGIILTGMMLLSASLSLISTFPR